MQDELWQVVLTTCQVAVCTTAVVMISAMALALCMLFVKSPILRVLELLICVPMAMPPVALGYGLLVVLGPNSYLGGALHEHLGLDVAFTFVGAVLSSVLVSFGIGLRGVRHAFEQIERGQLHVARLMGANHLQLMFHIILPQCAGAILGSAILVFIRALSEFGATMVFAGNFLGQTRTLALAIWISLETPGGEREALMLLSLAALISLMALVSAEILISKQKRL